MPTNERILELNQAGLESTRGTDAAATRKIYAEINPSYNRPPTEFIDRSGTFGARRRIAYGRPEIGFTATDLMTFEDAPWWFQLALKGGVAGVTDGGTPPAYTYTFVPNLTTDDLKSMTLEFNESGNPYQSTQVMVNSWTIRIDPDNEGGWMWDADLLGRDWTTTTYTGSITDRTTEVIRAPGTKMYLDTATLGGLDIFVLAVIFAILIIMIGFIGSLVLKEVGAPSSATMTATLVVALIFAALTLVPQIVSWVSSITRGNIPAKAYPLIGAVLGYLIRR